MNPTSKRTPLEIHTLDTLCKELVSGRGVVINGDGKVIQLCSDAGRAIFDWYRCNQAKWSGNNRMDDVRRIAEQLEKPPPDFPVIASSTTAGTPLTIHLKSVRAHRFAGIHRYGGPTEPPPDFEFEIESPLSIIEGNNGAGKTSLLSAITWCLTGHIYRSHRPPESADAAIEIQASQSGKPTENDPLSQTVSAITPLPSAEILRQIGDSPLPLDTWVELTFVDDADNEVATIRRSIERTSRGGSIKVTSPNLSCLPVPPVALEVGTRMTGLLPYLQLGEKSELGAALAELTGFRPLKDLVSHAKKSQKKLRKDLPAESNKEIAKLDEAFMRESMELAALIHSHPEIASHRPLPQPSSVECEKDLKDLKIHFEKRQTEAFTNARSILGDAFDPSDKDTIADLEKNTKPAIAAVGATEIAKLPSAKRLHDLAHLSEEDLGAASLLVEEIDRQATEIAFLMEDERRAARLQLYAKLAAWIKQDHDSTEVPEQCPVCAADLTGKIDPVTGRAICDHLQEYLSSDSGHLQHTVEEWTTLANNRLSGDLCDTLSREMRQELPKSPSKLIEAALAEELFQTSCFSGALETLQSDVQRLCAVHLAVLPAFEEPAEHFFPSNVQSMMKNLACSVNFILRAIAFSRWRTNSTQNCQQAFVAIIGQPQPDVDPSVTVPVRDKSPLLTRLNAIDRLVSAAEPLRLALGHVERMEAHLKDRRTQEQHIQQYAEAADAIEDLFSLGEIVDSQVTTLMTALGQETGHWKDCLYSPSYTDAPRVSHPDVKEGGTLTIDAQSEGTKMPAQHICNASDLRATLLAILVAFWKHMLATRGGLSLLLFDDLQELFDPINRRRVARTMPNIAAGRTTLILTTNDHDFARCVAGAAKTTPALGGIDHRQVLPAKAVGLRMILSKSVDAIYRKRKDFEDSKTEDAKLAQDYLNELRIYLEARMLGFFDVPDTGIPKTPTFSDLIDAIRRRVRAGHEGFSGQVFSRLVADSALADGSDVVRLMNESHHGRSHLIPYNDVSQIRDDLKHVLALVRSAHEEYERWLRRSPPEITAPKPSVAIPAKDFSFTVRQIEVLAASTAGSTLRDVCEADEALSCDWLQNHAVFINTTDNFGFSGQRNCRVIVDLEDTDPADRSLVIALHNGNTYARRLLRPAESPTQVILAAETSDPLDRPRVLMLPTSEVRLLSVVGVLFGGAPVFPHPKGEAQPDESCDILKNVEIAFTVRGESALPLAIEGQIVLGGREVHPADIPSMEDKMVALATSDGCAFKRVGQIVSGAKHVRQFESIGGRGESILARTEDVEDDPFGSLPLVESVREIMGVLYPPIT